MKNVEYLDLEISNSCNAECNGCIRSVTSLPLNNYNLDLDFFKKHITKDYFPYLKKIRYCGNAGDPLANKDIVPITQYLRNQWDDCYIDIRTNGGLGNKVKWRDLGFLLNDRTKGAIWFGIDGDQNTNHMYRKNVVWSQLIKNVDTYINSGGRAFLQFIPFPWNKHQVKTMLNLSIEHGFKKFITRISKRTVETGTYFDQILTQLFDLNYNVVKLEPIIQEPYPMHECYAEIQKSVYISASKKVYPCCLLGTLEYYHKDDVFSSIVDGGKNELINNNVDTAYEQTVVPIYNILNTKNACIKCVNSCSLPFNRRDWYVSVDFETKTIHYDNGQVCKDQDVFL